MMTIEWYCSRCIKPVKIISISLIENEVIIVWFSFFYFFLRFLELFEKIEPIGAGGFGNVFKGISTCDKTTYAIKRVEFTEYVLYIYFCILGQP